MGPICSRAKAAKHACRLANVSRGAIKTCPRGATSRQRQPSAPVIRAQNPTRWYTSPYIAAWRDQAARLAPATRARPISRPGV
ncbi:hypothetical protein G6F31_019821 [Rhizopus arrhizus]|nr:hypothetical protein G6F31_019821 [Rhizopus arrhizus]